MTATDIDRKRIARVLKDLADRAETYATHLGDETDYWEGGGSPMESHYELLDEADALVRELRA